MSRRPQPCKSCTPQDGAYKDQRGRFDLPRGFTRHRDRVCARCRHDGPPTTFIDKRGRAA